jgi:hypothetical protein
MKLKPRDAPHAAADPDCRQRRFVAGRTRTSSQTVMSQRFQASQTESFSVPVNRYVAPGGQLDGQQFAVPAGIFRDLVSARASARRLASERFPHLDCRHLLRPNSFAAALAYPFGVPSSLPRFQLTFRKMEMLEVRSQYGFERSIPGVWAQLGTPPCWAQMVLPALPCSLE